MAHTDHTPDHLLMTVAREIGEFIDQMSQERVVVEESPPLEIAETLTLWKLSEKAFETLGKSRLSGDLSNWVEPTNYLYHQLRLRGEAVGFARSRHDDKKGESTVRQVSYSRLAARLNHLFMMIEANRSRDDFVADDPVVRLLEIPAFEIFAVWLFSERKRESRLVISDAPKRYEMPQGSVLNSEQFFDALSRGGPLLGVI